MQQQTCPSAVDSQWIYSRVAIQQQSRLSLRLCSSSPARRRFPYGGLILVQPSSSGRASPPLSVQRQYRLPSGSHPAAAAPLSSSVCAEAVPVASWQPSSSGRASPSPSVCAEVGPITFRQPSSSSCASSPYLSLSVQEKYRLPPGSHPAAAAPLPLCLCRGSTSYLPAAIQQRPRLSLSLGLCRGRTDYLPAAIQQ